MSTDIVRAAPLPDKIRYAQALAESNLLPQHYQRQPANLLLALEYAEALGVPPINAITGIVVIKGKPSASADLIAAMVRKAGHKLRISGDDKHATAQIIRADDPDYVYEATWDEQKARTAGLWGTGNWKTYPAAMLRARAITEVARMGASDALYGVIYTPEELGAKVDEDGDVVTAEPVAERPKPTVQQIQRAFVANAQMDDDHYDPDRNWEDEIDATNDVDALTALGREAKQAGAMTPDLQEYFRTRRDVLTATDVTEAEVVEEPTEPMGGDGWPTPAAIPS